MDDLLASRISESLRQELESQDKVWDEARLMATYLDSSLDSFPMVTCLFRAGGEMGSIALTQAVWGDDSRIQGIWRDLQELREVMSVRSDSAVMRLRVALSSPQTQPIVEVFHDLADGTIDWVWPDEPGYGGRVFSAPEMERRDSWEYGLVAGSVGEVGDSLRRIGGWLGENVPELAVLLNEAASIGELDAFEERLGVLLPESVREAWLVHGGQSGRGAVLRYEWLSLAESAEQLSYFERRSDGGFGFVPVFRFEDQLGFVESVSSRGADGPVWVWEIGSHRDLKIADSFGEYLAWFANACDAGEMLSVFGGVFRKDEV